MQYDMGIVKTLDTMFAGILTGGLGSRYDETTLQDEDAIDRITKVVENQRVNLRRFKDYFPSNIFQDEYAVFYEIIVGLNEKMFDGDQLISILDTNKDLILDSPYIDMERVLNGSDITLSEDEKVELFKQNMLQKLNTLSGLLVDELDYDSCCKIYMDFYKRNYMQETALNMVTIMGNPSGITVKFPRHRRKTFKGVDGCAEYYSSRKKIIDELQEEKPVRNYVVDQAWLEEELARDVKGDARADEILKFGLTEIDKVYGSIKRGDMIGILGKTKGGKTRFTNHLVANALASGLNVAIWTADGTSAEWESTQIASYIRRNYGQSVNSKSIMKREYDVSDGKGGTINVSGLVTGAKTALALKQGGLGTLSFINGALNIETFIDVLEAHYNDENPYDVLIIDALVNMQSTTGMGKSQRISESYMALKSFITNKLKTKAIAIVPAQLKQESIDRIRNDPESEIYETDGAESSETIRTPDLVIGLTSTDEELAQNMMRFHCAVSRHTEKFKTFYGACDLACCYFYSDPSLNED